MDPELNALPTGAPAEASEQSTADAAAELNTEQPPVEGQAEGEQAEKPAKPEKTQEQREIERLRRRVDNLTRQKYELRASAPQPAQQQQRDASQGDGETVTLTRSELERMTTERAKELAPMVKQQQEESERQHGVIQSLAKQWGTERFKEITDDLDDVLGGMANGSDFKPATLAILESDAPREVIEFLTDPDNADDAQRVRSAPSHRVGREIARIEVKLKEQKARAKDQPSNAARPLESVKGGGVPSGMPNPSDTKAYIAWANAQERAARA